MLFEKDLLPDSSSMLTMEAMKYNPHSPFAKAMIAIFEQGIEEYRNLPEGMTIDAGVVTMARVWKDKLGPALCSVIKDHIGLPVVKINPKTPEVPTGNFSILMRAKYDPKVSANIWHEIDRIMLQIMNKADMHPDTYAYLKQVESYIDTRLDKFIKTDELSKLFDADINIDITYMYFLAEKVSDDFTVIPADQCAAVIAHEVGHTIGTFRNLKLIDVATKAKQQLRQNFLQKASNKEIATFAEAVIKQLGEQREAMKEYPLVQRAVQLVGELIEFAKKGPTFLDENRGGWFRWVMIMIFSVIFFPFVAIFAGFWTATGVIYNAGAVGIVSFVEKLNNTPGSHMLQTTVGGKTNDLPVSIRNLYEIERIADEFAILHGLGSAFALMFENDRKMQLLFPTMFFKPTGTTKRLDKVCRVLWNLFDLQFMALYPGMIVHEHGIDRVNTMGRDLIKQLRLVSKDPQLERHLIYEIEQILAIHKRYQFSVTNIHAQTGGRVMLFIKRIVDAITPVDSIKFDEEFNKLMTDIGKLDNNLFYLLAAKFRNLT